MQKPARSKGDVGTRNDGRNAQVDDIALTNVRASAPPATVKGGTQVVISACSAAIDELISSRALIDALEKENSSLKTRHQTDQQMIDLLTELDETRNAETEALRSTIAAKNEALNAKDAVIAIQDKLIDELKRKKPSPWKRLGDVLIGVGIAAIFK